MGSNARTSVFVVVMMLASGCHRSSLDYVAPPAATESESGLGRLDTAVAGALRAAYHRQDARAQDAPPVSLVPTDGSELALRALDANVAIAGPLAHVALRFTFHNAEPRVREGRFAITLPTDAAIGRFAMKNADGWREARVVSRTKGREVYERFLHRRVDPALLEQDIANQFSARVFPIAASADKEIAIEYDARVAPGEPFTVALHGLPRVESLAITVDRDGDLRTVAKREVVPDDVAVEVANGDRAIAAGEAFAARVDLAPSEAIDAIDPLDHVAILVDTSASRAPLMARQARLVHDLLAAFPDNAFVSLSAFDQDVTELYRGPARAGADASDQLLARGALGASDLGRALAHASVGGARRVIVIGDGAPTAGEADPARLANVVRTASIERVDAIQLGQAIDRDTLQAVVAAGKRPGAILEHGDAAALARSLALALPPEQDIRVAGATAVWPNTTRGLAPGAPVWVFGLRDRSSADSALAIEIGGQSFHVAVRAGDEARVRRAVAGAEIAELTRRMNGADGHQRDELAQRIEKVALEHGLVSAQTSLLVLESDADEHRMLDTPAPTIDPTSTVQGITIDRNYTRNIPVPGRTFDAVLGAAAGSQNDRSGVSFSGSTSLENQYYVDGVNTTGLSFQRAGGEPDEPTYAEPYTGTLRDVMRAIAAHDRARALSLASAWQADSPGELAAIIALGEALEARGASTLAARAYGSIMDLYPKRAELLRAAGERLDRVPGGRALAIDAYRRAIRERPDQVSTYRLLAYDLMRTNQVEALDVVSAGLAHATRPSITTILTEDSSIIASYLLDHVPAARADILARVRGPLPKQPSIRFVLSWETDANDVDLHVFDRHHSHAFYSQRTLPSGGSLLDDITTGFGPEMFEITEPRAFPYRLGVHYYSRGPEGVGLGTVQVIRFHGAGVVEIEDRPFVLQNDNAMIGLGTVEL